MTDEEKFEAVLLELGELLLDLGDLRSKVVQEVVDLFSDFTA